MTAAVTFTASAGGGANPTGVSADRLTLAGTGVGAQTVGAGRDGFTFGGAATGEWTGPINVATFTAGLSALSDGDLATLRSAVIGEMQRRAALGTTLTQIRDLTDRYRQALGPSPKPTPWLPSHILYGPGELVTHRGKTYRNDSRAVLDGTDEPSPSSPWWTLVP